MKRTFEPIQIFFVSPDHRESSDRRRHRLAPFQPAQEAHGGGVEPDVRPELLQPDGQEPTEQERSRARFRKWDSIFILPRNIFWVRHSVIGFGYFLSF